MKGNKASDCLRPPLVDTLSPECKALKYTYGTCKRNLIDMRKRFRGPVPMSYRKNVGETNQLYSGIDSKGQNQPSEGDNDSSLGSR